MMQDLCKLVIVGILLWKGISIHACPTHHGTRSTCCHFNKVLSLKIKIKQRKKEKSCDNTRPACPDTQGLAWLTEGLASDLTIIINITSPICMAI